MALLVVILFVVGLFTAPWLTLGITFLVAMIYIAAKLWWLWLIIFLIWVVSGMPSTNLDDTPANRDGIHRNR